MKNNDWLTYKRLLGYIWPYATMFVLSVLGFLAGSGAEAYFLSLFGQLLDNWEEGLADAVLFIPLMMFLAAIVRGVGELVGEFLLSRITFTVEHNIRTQLFNQLLLMPSSFYDGSSQGHLVSRITYNVTQLRDTGTDGLKTIVQDGSKVIVYFGYMLFLSWKLTFIFVAAVPVIALVVLWASKRFRSISRRIQGSMGDLTHLTSETVSGYQVVRIFGGQEYERKRFERASDTNRRQNLKMTVTKTASTHVVQTLVVAAVAVLISLLARPEIVGVLSIGNLVVFLGLAGMLARPIKKLTDVNARLQRGLAAAEDVFNQLDQEVEKDSGTVDVERMRGEIEFKNVGFNYASSGRPVLKNVSLRIEPGQTVALVGKSGSGKSTLASLIPRFYDVGEGSLTIDGVPVNEYRLTALRKQIAIVSQQVTLFNDTLERNIAYGTLAETDPSALDEAIERANARSIVDDLPKGLQSLVGDDGVLLSGGQRQRVAIARALLKDAPILILDEATSALDTESERHIQSALEEVMKGRTTLVIAHRLSTIEKADLIVVLDNGKVVEQGHHRDLIALGGAYARLHNAQFEDEDGEIARRAAQILRPTPVMHGSTAVTDGWYEDAWWSGLLKPASWLFGKVSGQRRRSNTGWSAPVPVIIVGNITVGGTGKTPFVLWLVEQLKARGFKPGIVSRGYGGSAGKTATKVQPKSDPGLVGDEALLLASRSGVSVVVCSDRVSAVELLIEQAQCDVIVSDDGLQHYALNRDLEIVIMDGVRGIGNGRLLPAGPLREPVSRLDEVDWVVSNSQATDLVDHETVMSMEPTDFINLGSGKRLGPAEFVRQASEVNAVCGIGNPARFSDSLAGIGLIPYLHTYTDHHVFRGEEVIFTNTWPIVCTEKDAVKINALKDLDEHVRDNVWYLEVRAVLPTDAQDRLAELLDIAGIAPGQKVAQQADG
ncbi:MAG: lipid A export permease/ATP-binding protein MsbA [Proteobacteria bacterium]|nr:lipid A export permease/ATP-binding protein MsbA [Pseudomonadota bacterium]